MNDQVARLYCGAEFDDEIPPSDAGEPEEADEVEPDEEEEADAEFA